MKTIDWMRLLLVIREAKGIQIISGLSNYVEQINRDKQLLNKLLMSQVGDKDFEDCEMNCLVEHNNAERICYNDLPNLPERVACLEELFAGNTYIDCCNE